MGNYDDAIYDYKDDFGRDAEAWNLRLGKADKLHSVYSVCLYHGAWEWDGPRSPRDIMDFEDAPPGWRELYLDRDTAETIAVFTNNTKMLNMLEEEREDYDMCKALEDLVADGKAEGKAEALLDNIRKLMCNMSLAAEQAMEILEVPEEERGEFLAKL